MTKAEEIITYKEQGFAPAEIASLTGSSLDDIAAALGLAKMELQTPKGIPIESMLSLANQGMNDSQIARVLGCSNSNVSARLAPHRLGLAELPSYKENKTDLFNLKQSELLKALTPAKIKEMSALQIVTSIGILEDKIRKEGSSGTKGVLDLVKIIVANARPVRGELIEPSERTATGEPSEPAVPIERTVTGSTEGTGSTESDGKTLGGDPAPLPCSESSD